MLHVEREREIIQSLSAKDQVRMAMFALNGWTFSLHAAGAWCASKRGYFDHYGCPLERCLDSVERSPRTRTYRLDDPSSWGVDLNLPDAAKMRPGAPGKN